jgi:hypothetical protein
MDGGGKERDAKFFGKGDNVYREWGAAVNSNQLRRINTLME